MRENREPVETPPGNRRAGASRKEGAVARLRLTRRLAAALLPLEGAQLDADVETPPLPHDAETLPLLRTDLMIRALDLRIRLSLLPGRGVEALDDSAVLSAARRLLIANPETASIAVIADDKDLTCRIVEPFDEPDVVVPAGSAQEQSAVQGPAGPVLRRYLVQIDPGWQPPPRVTVGTLDLVASTEKAARQALAQVQLGGKNTPEWRKARQNLTTSDADWVARLALGILEERVTDPVADIKRQSAAKPA